MIGFFLGMTMGVVMYEALRCKRKALDYWQTFMRGVRDGETSAT